MATPRVKPEDRKKMGRPTKYNEKVVVKILAHLAQGKSLHRTSKAVDISLETIFEWLHKYPDFAERYARAKQESADMMAEEVMDIADDGRNDYMEDDYMKGRSPGWSVNGENIQRSKLRVDTRKWLMAKMKPKKYGDQIDVTSGGEKVKVAPIYGGASTVKGDDGNSTTGEAGV
jgi:transposase